jgi:hypothetical protein
MENGAYVTRSQLIGAERRAPAGDVLHGQAGGRFTVSRAEWYCGKVKEFLSEDKEVLT